MLNTINVASSGLAAAREQVENVMNNIANENTPGYKKRVVGISEASHIDARLTGRGVLVGETTRVTNVYLYDNLTSESSKKTQYEELSMMLSDIEAIFYETEDSGFSADLDRYFQSIENLRSNPSNEIYKNNLRNTGTAIVDDLKTLYSDIEQRELIASNSISDNVEELNSILNDIGAVNKSLTESAIVSNDLLDKRDHLEQEIAAYIDIDIDRTNNYELKIGGMTAVRFDNNIHKITVNHDKVMQKDIYYDGTSSTLINQATWSNGDKVTYKLDNQYSVTITHGEDIAGFGTVDEDNAVRALVYKINSEPHMGSIITAYNGQYTTDSDGNKIEKTPTNQDHYLMIESDISGRKGNFKDSIVVTDGANKNKVSKDMNASLLATDNVHLDIFDRKLILKAGKLKPMINNISTKSTENYFNSYKTKLDNLANALSDLSNSFIKNDDDTYVYGVNAVDIDANSNDRVDIGLFSGSTVDTLKFNSGIVGGLDQDKLDYLATLQWKTDIDIDNTGENPTSLSKYNRSLRVQIAEDKENNDFKKDTQDAVTQSLQNTYNKMTKVDKDEEMMNLIKFQAAYEANAKLITIIDEMLNTILGMKR